MLFTEIVTNYLEKEKNNYNRVINRRKERFLKLIKLNAPKEIIIKEISLLRQPFYFYVAKRIQGRLGHLFRVLTLMYIFSYKPHDLKGRLRSTF